MRTFTIVKYLFSLIGFLLLAGALFFYLDTKTFITSAVATEGTVIELIPGASSDGSTIYTPVVRFSDPNSGPVTFTSSTSSNPPSYSEGEKVKVFYLPSEPTQAKIDGYFSLWGMSTIFGGLGIVFFAIGMGILLSQHLRRQKDERLRREGIPITTRFQEVVIDKTLSANGHHPFRVVTYWKDPDSSGSYLFESDAVWFDPTDFLSDKAITVYVERGDLDTYYVDLSFLPKVAG